MTRSNQPKLSPYPLVPQWHSLLFLRSPAPANKRNYICWTNHMYEISYLDFCCFEKPILNSSSHNHRRSQVLCSWDRTLGYRLQILFLMLGHSSLMMKILWGSLGVVVETSPTNCLLVVFFFFFFALGFCMVQFVERVLISELKITLNLIV